MKLIGITGKSGSGKTTLSDMLAQNENVGVIHGDKLFDKVKQQNLFHIMECDEKGNPITAKKNIRRFVYGNKYMFLAYIRLKAILSKRTIKRKIKELENQGKDIIVIECVHLKYYPIFKKLDKRILVERPYIERQKSVLARDKNMDKDTFVMWDMPYKRSYYKENRKNYDNTIYNESKEQLKQEANYLYRQITKTTEKQNRKENFRKYQAKIKNRIATRQQAITKERKEEEAYETR